MKVGSLFTGVGGFDLALERAGMEVVWQSEVDRFASEVLEDRWPGVPNLGDINKISNPPYVDLMCGGFPCQDISVAGKKAGLSGGRSGLWFEYERLLREVRPEWVVIENVERLLSSNGGRDMGTVVTSLGELGYGWAYRVLNSQGFGVPQRRRRVFIVGHLAHRPRSGEVLFKSEGLQRDSVEGGGQGSEDAGRTQGSTNPSSTNTLTASSMNVDDNTAAAGFIVDHATQTPVFSSEVCPTLSSTAKYGVVSIHENQQSRVSINPLMGTLTTGGGKPGQGYPAILEGGVPRKLTPVECERLQGFPDGWTQVCSDTQRYRQMGNAVSVPVVQWIGERIMKESQYER